MSSPTTPDTGHPAVELIEITKEYPGVLANDRISLAVRRGEVHCLLGENGAGKSTLMNILSGMVRPDSGEVRLGRPPRRDPLTEARDRASGSAWSTSTRRSCRS